MGALCSYDRLPSYRIQDRSSTSSTLTRSNRTSSLLLHRRRSFAPTHVVSSRRGRSKSDLIPRVWSSSAPHRQSRRNDLPIRASDSESLSISHRTEVSSALSLLLSSPSLEPASSSNREHTRAFPTSTTTRTSNELAPSSTRSTVVCTEDIDDHRSGETSAVVSMNQPRVSSLRCDESAVLVELRRRVRGEVHPTSDSIRGPLTVSRSLSSNIEPDPTESDVGTTTQWSGELDGFGSSLRNGSLASSLSSVLETTSGSSGLKSILRKPSISRDVSTSPSWCSGADRTGLYCDGAYLKRVAEGKWTWTSSPPSARSLPYRERPTMSDVDVASGFLPPPSHSEIVGTQETGSNPGSFLVSSPGEFFLLDPNDAKTPHVVLDLPGRLTEVDRLSVPEDVFGDSSMRKKHDVSIHHRSFSWDGLLRTVPSRPVMDDLECGSRYRSVSFLQESLIVMYDPNLPVKQFFHCPS